MPRPVRPTAPAAAFSEAPAWAAVGTGWRPLFGSYHALGFSFEWHEFELAEELDWARSFHPGSVELCLNLEGRARLTQGQRTIELGPRTSVFYVQGEPPLRARRLVGGKHRFITAEFAPEFLERHLQAEAGHLHPFIRAMVETAPLGSAVATPEPIQPALMQLVESLRRCPVFKPAQEMWFRCKALELVAQAFFCPPDGEMFCTRQQRAACERAGRVREILAGRLADPPSLEELGRLVGCSPFYLSRQFSEATGLTIQQFLRQARMERAAGLLRTGRHNVTEAALEVGYNSLSHFTVAFRETFGCCPGLYPLQLASPAGPGVESTRIRGATARAAVETPASQLEPPLAS
jgi:AraC-like DNA-binding protein